LPKEGLFWCHSQSINLVSYISPNILNDWYLQPIEAYPKEFVEWLSLEDYYLHDGGKHTWITNRSNTFEGEYTLDELYEHFKKELNELIKR